MGLAEENIYILSVGMRKACSWWNYKEDTGNIYVATRHEDITNNNIKLGSWLGIINQQAKLQLLCHNIPSLFINRSKAKYSTKNWVLCSKIRQLPAQAPIKRLQSKHGWQHHQTFSSSSDPQMHSDIFFHLQFMKMVIHSSQAQSLLLVPPYTYIELHPDHLHDTKYACLFKKWKEKDEYKVHKFLFERWNSWYYKHIQILKEACECQYKRLNHNFQWELIILTIQNKQYGFLT